MLSMVKKTSLGLFNRPITHSLIKRSYKHTLPNLPYEYSALEPVISSELLNFHHQKHHQAYVNNLNAAQEKLNEAHSNNDLNNLLTINNTLKFNYGGHINHSIYWQNLSPNGGGKPNDPLMTAIKNCFGSFDTMVNLMTNAAVAVQGSGWAWLGYNSQNKSLQIATTGNQELLQSAAGLTPLLTIDVWEHAYYLQYKNLRPNYVKAIWDIINWKDVEERYSKALAK